MMLILKMLNCRFLRIYWYGYKIKKIVGGTRGLTHTFIYAVASKSGAPLFSNRRINEEYHTMASMMSPSVLGEAQSTMTRSRSAGIGERREDGWGGSALHGRKRDCGTLGRTARRRKNPRLAARHGRSH